MKRALCRVFLLALIAAGVPAFAGYQEGLNAFSEGDYAEAMREWRAVVDGPADAVVPPIYAETHYAIATLYWRGLGVEQDYEDYHELVRPGGLIAFHDIVADEATTSLDVIVEAKLVDHEEMVTNLNRLSSFLRADIDRMKKEQGLE